MASVWKFLSQPKVLLGIFAVIALIVVVGTLVFAPRTKPAEEEQPAASEPAQSQAPVVPDVPAPVPAPVVPQAAPPSRNPEKLDPIQTTSIIIG